MGFKEICGTVYYVRESGGPGSGNFGHAGIPGQVGGSTPGDGGTGIQDLSNAPVEGFKTPQQINNYIGDAVMASINGYDPEQESSSDYLYDEKKIIKADIEENLLVDTSKLGNHPEINKYTGYNNSIMDVYKQVAPMLDNAIRSKSEKYRAGY